MEFLRVLEGARTPGLSAFMAAITWLGDETVFILVAVTIFWCVSKRWGYYIFAVGLTGTVASQWLKLACRVPRPWVLDPDFTIVESARAAATGYSFPSGHSQNVVGTFGCLALSSRRLWLRAVCVAVILLVPFSRMYLGVHTPLDVGVGVLIPAVLLPALWPCFRDDAHFRRTAAAVLGGMLVCALAYVVWTNVTRFPADIDAENLAHGVKNGWSLLGCTLGLIVSACFDRRRLHFDEKAPLLGQVCKVILGLALLLAVRVGLKYPLSALAGDALWTNAARYFLMVAFVGCVWPMTFPYFARLGKKNRETAVK